MARGVKFRRGTTADHAAFTGAEGEITINTDKDIAVVHDGSTVGGKELVGVAATQTLTNKTLTNPSISNVTITGVATATEFDSLGITTTRDLQVVGVTTTGTLGVLGLSTTRNLNVVGVATATEFDSLGIATTRDLLVVGVTTTTTLGVTGFSTARNLTVVGVTTSSGGVEDLYGNVRDVPQNAQTTGYILDAADAGRHVSITSGGVTVPAGVFGVGDLITVYNNSSSPQTITQGANVTLRFAATASTGNRTLAQYGICSIICVGIGSTFVISGAGLT